VWVLNALRSITSCPDGSCPNSEYFDGIVVIGEPGFGVLRRTSTTLRITDLLPDPTSGGDQFFGIGQLPMGVVGGCGTNPPKQEYCGHWNVPCSSIANSIFDETITMSLYNDSIVVQERRIFRPGTGCSTNDTLGVFRSRGAFAIDTNATTPVQFAAGVTFKPEWVEVTLMDREPEVPPTHQPQPSPFCSLCLESLLQDNLLPMQTSAHKLC